MSAEHAQEITVYFPMISILGLDLDKDKNLAEVLDELKDYYNENFYRIRDRSVIDKDSKTVLMNAYRYKISQIDHLLGQLNRADKKAPLVVFERNGHSAK